MEYAIREAERKQAAIEEWEKEHGTGIIAAGGAGWLSQVFGSLGGVSGAVWVETRRRWLNVRVDITEHRPKADPTDDLSRG